MLSNLKAALAARGMRQADLAAALKIHASVVSEIICGRRKADIELRTRIAAMLAVENQAWLFKSVVPPHTTRVDSGALATS